MVYTVNEPVKVAVVFDAGTIKPFRFSWRGVSYAIKTITFTWKDRQGGGVIYRFAVSDGTNNFQLGYHSENLTWKLEAVDVEG
jgi:hypothetical protein